MHTKLTKKRASIVLQREDVYNSPYIQNFEQSQIAKTPKKEKYLTKGKIRLCIISHKSKLNVKGDAPIYITYSLRGTRFYFNTQQHIKPRFWDKTNERVIPQATNATSINNVIKDYKNRITSIVENAFMQPEPIPITNDYIRNELKKYLNAFEPIHFFDYYDKWLKYNATKDSEQTIKGYRTVKKHLLSYATEHDIHLTLNNMNVEFLTDFVAYFRDSTTPNGDSYSENTLFKWIKTIRLFMNWCIDRDYTKNDSYKKFKIAEIPTEIEYLTQHELQQIAEIDIQANTPHDKVRDIFLFGSNTGLRFIDLMNLKFEHINFEKKVLEIRPIKTSKKQATIEIPLLEQSLKIIQKYQNQPDQNRPLPSISNQKANQYIKEICQLAGINKPCIRADKKTPKYELITMHCARHNFVIHCLESGMERETIMAITGHKNDKTFKRYVQISSTQRTKEMYKLQTNRNNINK